MPLRTLLAATLLLATSSAALAAAAPLPKFSTARVIADVRTLSSDAFEGRGPATAGEKKTVAYIVR